MKEAIATYIVDESTVAIIEPPYEADDHCVEHWTVFPVTFRGDSSPKKDAMPLDEAPIDIRDRVINDYNSLLNNNCLRTRVIGEATATSLAPTQDI